MALFTDRLKQSLEVAVSSFASELADAPVVPLRAPAVAAAATKKRDKAPKAPKTEKAKSVVKGGRRCRNCGQEGVLTKSCGKTRRHPGTGVAPARTVDDEGDPDDEPEPAPEPVVDPQPPVAVAPVPPPRSTPRVVEAQPRPAPTALRSLQGGRTATQKLEDLKAARDERIRRLVAKKTKAVRDPDRDRHAPAGDPDVLVDDDEGEISVDDAIRLGSAQL